MSSLDCLFKGTGGKGHGTGYGRARLLLSQIYRQVVRSASQEWNGRNGETGKRRSHAQRWEGEAPAEPKRKRMANSDWRIAIFLDGSAPALPKKFFDLTNTLRTQIRLTGKFALP
ncbi:hypothetical protein [Fervidibacter sacchari]